MKRKRYPEEEIAVASRQVKAVATTAPSYLAGIEGAVAEKEFGAGEPFPRNWNSPGMAVGL